MANELENVLEVIDDLKDANQANVKVLKQSLLDISVKLEELNDGENLMLVRNTLADFRDTLEAKFQNVFENIEKMRLEAQNDEKAAQTTELLEDRFKSMFNLFDSGLNTIADKLENLDNKFANSSKNNFENLKSELLQISENLKLYQRELLESDKEQAGGTIERFSFVAESIKQFSENLKTQISTALEKINEIPQETSENLIKEFKLLSDAGHDALAEIKILEDYAQNLTKSVNKIVDFTENNTNEGIVEAIKELDIAEHITNLFAKIDVFNNNFNIKTEFLEDQIREMKTMFADISIDIQNKEAQLLQKETERTQEYFNKIEDVSNNLVNLEESLKLSGVEYKEHITALNKELTEFIAEFNTIYNEIAGSTQVEINSSLDELKQFITINSTNYNDKLIIIQEQFSQAFKDLYEALRTNNFELIEKGLHADDLHNMSESQLALLESIKTKIDTIETVSLDEKADSILTKIDTINEKTNAINQKFNSLNNQNEQTSRAVDELSKDFNTFSEEQKNANNKLLSFSKEVYETAEELNSKVDALALSDYTDNFDELTDEILENRDALTNEILENRDTLTNIEAKIDNLPKPKDFSDDFDEIWEQNIDNRKLLDELNAKLDIFVTTDDTEMLADELEEIKELILEQQKFIDNSETENNKDISENLQNLLTKIDGISATISEHDENTAKIKEDLLNTFVSVFSNSNFVEETEEIKDFVEEKTDELGKQLVDVKSQIEAMKNSDIEDYSYTLADVESDIAKLRQVLNDISVNTPSTEINQISRNIHNLTSSIDLISKNLTPAEIYQLKTNILKLNEDILSISSRTNKLLLNSDEAQKTIAEGLLGFTHIAYNLEERMKELSNKEFNEELANKTEKILMLLENGANSDATIQKVLMYLGEWVDASSKTFENLEEKTEEITAISDALSELRKAVPEKVALLDYIEERFEEQQSRVDRLESKMDDLADLIKAAYNPAQNQKIEKLESMLASMSANIEKLTSYVD